MNPVAPSSEASIRLADLPRRSRAIVVHHATDPCTAERLSALGLGVGACFQVLRSGSRPTVQVGESRLGLGPEFAAALHAQRR